MLLQPTFLEVHLVDCALNDIVLVKVFYLVGCQGRVGLAMNRRPACPEMLRELKRFGARLH
jgi:hypothetical protein